MNTNKKLYSSHSPTMTEACGAAFAEALCRAGKTDAFIALYGEMGVGKTAFTRGFCRFLGVESVHSPTYTVVNEYMDGSLPVFHFDMYRITTEDDLYSIGFEEYLSRGGFALCEWSENVEAFLPDDVIAVTIRRTDSEGGRSIEIDLPEEVSL